MPMLTASPPPPAVEPGRAQPAAAGRCLNCGAELGGAFCGRCGQKADTERMRFPRLVRDFAGGVLSLDVAALRTLRALATRPGPFIREYLLGRRVGYAGPLGYYVLVVALNLAVHALLGDAGVAPAERSPDEGFWEKNFVAAQLSVAFAVLVLPLAGAQRLLHRRAGYSVAEHYAFVLYVLAQSWLAILVLGLALLPFGVRLTGDADGVAWLVVFNAYLLWAMRGFYAGAPWKSALRLLGSYLVLLGALLAAGLLWLPFSGR